MKALEIVSSTKNARALATGLAKLPGVFNLLL
jgi:hypothetical protein